MMKKLFLRDLSGIFHRTKKCLLAVSLCAVLSFLTVVSSAVFPKAGSVATFLNYSATFLFLVLLFALPIILAIAAVQVHRYYYQSFLGEERLFTLMLPVKRGRMLFSRLLANGAWSLLFALVGLFAVFVGVLFPFELLLQGINASLISNLMRTLPKLLSPLSALSLLLGIVAETLLIDAAITAGTVLFPRRRGLGMLLFLLLFCGGTLLIHLGTYLALNAVLEEFALWGNLLSLFLSLLFGTAGALYAERLIERRDIML